MRGTKTMYNPEVETATRTEMESLQLILHQIRPVEFDAWIFIELAR